MKKHISLFILFLAIAVSAQQEANRFFYELTFKPKKNSTQREKVLTSLDIVKDKSIYQDFTVVAQDSIIKAEVEAMEKAGIWKDMSKSIKMPKFSYKIYKTYPSMNISYNDRISMKLFSFDDPTTFKWNILTEKEKIGEYNTQKATTDFGGRKWTAWFSTEIPFQDGPYKFHGLPGLIVKVEDSEKEYSWVLAGNKKIQNWEEFSYAEKANSKYGMSNSVVETTKEKFQKSYANYKADPLGEFRPYMTPEVMSRPMPGSDKTFGEFIKEQEKVAKDFLNANDNPVEK